MVSTQFSSQKQSSDCPPHLRIQLPLEVMLQNKLTFSMLRSNVGMWGDAGVVIGGGRVTPMDSLSTIKWVDAGVVSVGGRVAPMESLESSSTICPLVVLGSELWPTVVTFLTEE